MGAYHEYMAFVRDESVLELGNGVSLSLPSGEGSRLFIHLSTVEDAERLHEVARLALDKKVAQARAQGNLTMPAELS
jgi:hypothetical protein